MLYSVANDINNEFIAGKAQHVDLNEKEKLLLIWDVIATFTLDYSD